VSEKTTGKYDSPVKATIKGITDLFKKKDRVGELKESERLDGRKVLVTGASSGLGYAVATQLAERGATVIMAIRSGIPEKGEEIKKKTGSEDVYMLPVDLLETDSIQNLVKSVKEQFGQIDVFISNAAMVAGKARKTKQGLDEMFMVNYLAPYLLTRLLLQEKCLVPDVKNTPRIVVVSSESHRNAKSFNWNEFGQFKEFSMGKSVEHYGYTKLLLTTFVNELSTRLNPNNTTHCSVFSLCPGPVNSNIAREAPKVFHPLLKVVFGIFFSSPQKAAEPVLYHVASPDQEGKVLDYLFLMSRKEMDEKAMDPENGQKLWDLSEKLLSNLGVKLTSVS